jgi:hypothetical protein
LNHPLLEQPIQLDAGALEVASLKGKTELVEIELLLPSTPPEKLVIDLAAFDKLFKGVAPDDVLNNAEPYYGAVDTAEPKRRGRPRKGENAGFIPTPTKVKRDPQQLQAIRDWWRGQGNTIGDRGRIPASVEEAYNSAHQSS